MSLAKEEYGSPKCPSCGEKITIYEWRIKRCFKCERKKPKIKIDIPYPPDELMFICD